MENELLAAEEAVTKLTAGISGTVKRTEELSKTLVFPNVDNYKEADALYNEIHRVWNAGEKERKGFTAPLNEVLDKINGVFQPKLKWLQGLKAGLKERMDRYVTDEMFWKRKEQARVDAENRKKAEDEQLRKAEELAKQGNNKLADAVLEQPTVAPKAVVAAASDEGRSTVKTTWKAEIVDRKKFFYAMGDGMIEPSLVEINMAALDRIANSLKSTASPIAGVAFHEVASVGARR